MRKNVYVVPKVSICIPTYNQTALLQRTLNSILSQSYSDYEIIVTDDTPGLIVKKLVDQYDFNGKLLYFKNKSSLGTPANWNEAIKRSSGEYVKIMHHDDWFTNSDSLERYVSLLDHNPKSVLGFSASHVLFPNGQSWIHKIECSEVVKIQSCPAFLFLGNILGGPSAVIFKRNTPELFDEKMKWLVDVDFYIRIIGKAGQISYCNEALVTTYGAEGRVTDYCIDNPEVEVFENFYLFNKIKQGLLFKHFNYYRESLLLLLRLCFKYKISSRGDIRKYHYTGKIPLFFNFLLKSNLR